MEIQQFSAKPHILVVDDDERIRELVSRYLWDNGFIAMEAKDAVHAREMLRDFEYDAMVLDVMMPGETGFSFTESLRKEGAAVPVLLLTALGESQDRITGLEVGADDYLPKPFEPRELVLRLNAILRRTAKPRQSVQAFKIGRWQFDAEMGALVDGGRVVPLTAVEGTLIRALAQRPGEPISREELVRICKMDAAGDRTIDVQVTRLRRKIEDDPKVPRYLQTVRGKGYLLRIEDV
jgi:two-component system phosphate regulon response regulator OmpR